MAEYQVKQAKGSPLAVFSAVIKREDREEAYPLEDEDGYGVRFVDDFLPVFIMDSLYGQHKVSKVPEFEGELYILSYDMKTKKVQMEPVQSHVFSHIERNKPLRVIDRDKSIDDLLIFTPESGRFRSTSFTEDHLRMSIGIKSIFTKRKRR